MGIPGQRVIGRKFRTHHRRQIALDIRVFSTPVFLQEPPRTVVVGQGGVVIPVPPGELVQQHIGRPNEE
ncbi:hypothetical protein D3C86_2161130 [compost metagenome]